MCDKNKDDDMDDTTVPKSDCSPNENHDGKHHLPGVPAGDSPDVRVVWGSEGERPRIFMTSAARGRCMVRTMEIRREEYRQQHGRDYPSPFDSFTVQFVLVIDFLISNFLSKLERLGMGRN